MRSCTMRLLLGLALILLFLWLQRSQMSSSNNIPCEVNTASLSESTVSLLLSPLSLYSWLTSTLLRLVLSLPALIVNVLYHSLLLLMACPWCLASISFSLALTILRVALYLLHLALVLGVVAFLTLSQSPLAKEDMRRTSALCQHKVAGSRDGHQG